MKRPALRLTGLQQLLFKLTGIHSPTGGGGAANRFMAKYFEDVGLRATSDGMWHSRATCSAKAADRTVARRCCLYAPIDIHLEGGDSDFPWAGPKQTADLKPQAKMVGDWLFGLETV